MFQVLQGVSHNLCNRRYKYAVLLRLWPLDIELCKSEDVCSSYLFTRFRQDLTSTSGQIRIDFGAIAATEKMVIGAMTAKTLPV